VEGEQLGPVVDRLAGKRELGDAVAEAAVGELGAVLVVEMILLSAEVDRGGLRQSARHRSEEEH
jgi:hypothetical protein